MLLSEGNLRRPSVRQPFSFDVRFLCLTCLVLLFMRLILIFILKLRHACPARRMRESPVR